MAIALGGIGLPGGAVHVRPHAFRSRAWHSAVSAAGPATNAVMAIAALTSAAALHTPEGEHSLFVAGLAFFGFLQASTTVLNLLPVPGLDGWGAIAPYLPAHRAHAGDQVAPLTPLGVFLLLTVPLLGKAFVLLVAALAWLMGVPAELWQDGAAAFRFWS